MASETRTETRTGTRTGTRRHTQLGWHIKIVPRGE